VRVSPDRVAFARKVVHSVPSTLALSGRLGIGLCITDLACERCGTNNEDIDSLATNVVAIDERIARSSSTP
jgi:hypothetical protein